jgi:hypothetical protein
MKRRIKHMAETVSFQEISMPPEIASGEYFATFNAVGTEHQKYMERQREIFHELKRGRKIIDLHATLRAAGQNKDEDPRIAIAPWYAKVIFFHKAENGGGLFVAEIPATIAPPRRRHRLRQDSTDVLAGTYSYSSLQHPQTWGDKLKRQHIKTCVPTVPPGLNPKRLFKNHYILWEVTRWEPAEPPARKDPLLLRKLLPNVYSIVAKWDLTALEQAIAVGNLLR